MLANRQRWGALAWILTLQFFVVETIAELRQDQPYSRIDDVISALGSDASPAAALMNASFVLQGVLIAAGAWLLRPALPGASAPVTAVLLSLAGAGVTVVGVVPTDADGTVHAVGAVLYLAGGSLGLLALAHALRPRSEALGSTIAVIGVVSAAMTVFFLAGITRYLGEGGTERVAAYLLPVGLALSGLVLLRAGGEPAPAGPSRRERRAREREQLRAEQAAVAAERDAALARDATGDRPAATTPADHPADHPADDPGDAEDPWTSSRRRAD